MAKPGGNIPAPFPEPGPTVTTKPTPTVENYNLDLLFPPIVNATVPNPKVLDRTLAPRPPNQISLIGAKQGQPEPYIFGACIADPQLIHVDDSGDKLVLDVLWSVGEIDHFEGLFVDRVFEGRADQLGNIEHFHGTSGQAVSTIMAALKGSPTYDQLDEKAHSVMRWQVGWSLQIQGWVRGLKLYDPRVSPNLAYSANPALALRRMLVDCGYTVDDTTLTAAADYCDELIPGSGSPQAKRWAIGGQILQRATLRDWLQTLAAYASCFIDIRGGTAYIVADEPRAANHTITAADMIEGTVRVTGPGSRKVPEAVTVIGRKFERNTTTGDFTDGEVSYTYGTSGGAGTELTLNMPFFQTVDQCGRKAEEVYRRSRMRTLEFHTFDKGLIRTLGDVGTITNASYELSAVEMALIDYKAIDRGRWYLKYEEYLDANYSDTFFTSSTNFTTLYNPYNPPDGPTPDIDWQYNAASPQQPILTLTWVGVSWAYVQDYYVYIYSTESPQTIIYDSTFDGYIDHTSAGATHSVDLSGTPVVLGNTYTAEVSIRSNVQAIGDPGTDSVLVEVAAADYTVAQIMPDNSAFATLSQAFSQAYLTYVYMSRFEGTLDVNQYIDIPGTAVSSGSHVIKYESVSVDSGSGNFLVNGSAGVAGTWYELQSFDIQLKQETQTSPQSAEDATIDVTVADNDGGGSPVGGTEETFRARFVAYKGTNEYLVRDTFTDTTGTNLTAHTPDIQTTSPGGWTAHEGTFQISSSGLAAEPIGTSRYVLDAGTAAASIKAGMVLKSQDCGLIARAQDANNYWLLLVEGAANTDPVLKLIEVNAGVQTTRDSITLTGHGPLSNAAASQLRLMCNGDNIEGVFIYAGAGVVFTPFEVSYTSTSFNTETLFGLYGTSTGSPLVKSRWDAMYISDIEVGLII